MCPEQPLRRGVPGESVLDLVQAGVEGSGLRGKIVGPTLAEGLKVTELPAQGGQFGGVRTLKQGPVGLCAR